MTAAAERRYVAQYRTLKELCLTYGEANDVALARRLAGVALTLSGSRESWVFDRETGRRV